MTTPRPVRYRGDLPTVVVVGEATIETRVLELSETGAFIETTEPLADVPVGESCVVGLALPGGDPWTVNGRVQRHGASQHELRAQGLDHVTVLKRGIGVEFHEVDDENLERLRDFLELLEDR